jgi:hypothetical protein
MKRGQQVERYCGILAREEKEKRREEKKREKKGSTDKSLQPV